MNSVWLTSPFVKFNTDTLIYNETLCPETHFLNKFARDKHRTEDQNTSTNNERQGNFTVVPSYSSNSNLLSQDGTRDENIEENFTMTVNGSSCLKIDSKIISRKTKSKSTLSERSVHSRNVASYSKITDEAPNKIREVNVETELSSSNRTRSINYSKMKNDVAEDVENDLPNCPFELVQIYPGNKENINDLGRTFSDISREGSSLASFPKETKKSSKSGVAENDAAPLTQVKCGQCDESCESCVCHNESKAAEDDEEKNETFKLSIVRDIDSTTSSDDSETSRSTAKGKKRSTERSRKVLKRSEELMNYLDHNKKKMDSVNDSQTSRSRKACTEYDETRSFVSESEKTLIEDLIGMEERKDKVISSLVEADVCNTDVFDNNNMTKSRCEPSSVNNSSDNDFYRRNSTVIDANRRKLDSDMESINFKENLQTVTERREEGKNILNKIGTMRENDRQNGGNRTGERKITEYAIDDASNGMIEKSAPFSVDYGNIKICNLLSRIHEQLYNNFQKMENIWILLQDTSPIDSVRSAMPLRLLIRIISRCKSYIHDSHDSHKAESKIAKCLLSLVIDLAKSVDQNKLAVERQEQQLEGLLLKLCQEKNMYKKRIMINEVVSVWNHVLREISDIMQDISDKLRTVITESEEKENVRNQSSRRKDGVVESRGPKASLIRKESNIETQMAVTLNKHNAIKSPKAKTTTKFANTPRHQDVEKLSYAEPLRIGEGKMTDISLSRYNATKHPKSKPSTKSLNIQRYQDIERISYNEPVKNIERKMHDNISLSRYNATKHPKSKPSTKSLNIQRYQDVEKLSFNEPVKIVERKVNDSARYSEKGKLLKKPTQSVNFEQSRLPMPRQKYRVANNQQPVWRPGGTVKLPSSSSATTLALKNRQLLAQSSERSNQLTDNIKEGKHGRTGESKKKVPNSAIDFSKQSSRKYIMNPESTPKLKPKSRVLKVCFKEENGSSCRSESTCSERTLSERVNRQKTSKEAKVLKLLEEIIKSGPADKRDKKIANKSMIDHDQNETNSIDPERSTKPISIEEEMEIPQDEPTRDIDPNEVRQSRSKDAEVFDEVQQLIEKIPECPLTVIPPTDLSSSSIIKNQAMDSTSSVHLESSRSKNNSNFTCRTTTDCATELKPNSSYTVESTSFASQKVKPERQKNSSSVNVCSNSQTMSSTMLREFLRGQRVDVDCLNKAEECVKDRRKWRGCLKTKSVSLADVVTSNRQHGTCSEDPKESCCCRGDTLKGIVLSCERNSEDLEDAMKSLDGNCKDNLRLSEKRGNSTGTETNNENSSVQTKSVQIIIEEDAPLKQERQKNELNAVRDSMTVKTERQKNSSSINGCSNSQTMSLTMLKEFLRGQGVDVDLLNKAEQCVRDRRKWRGCLKTKSVSLADVATSNRQQSKCSEVPTEGDMLKDLEDASKLLAPEKKDTSTVTETNNKDSSAQTRLRETQTKGIQIIIEEDGPLKEETETMETQTEMISIKHTGTDCCREMTEAADKSNLTDASSMTESTKVKDSVTETARVSYVAKLTATEQSKTDLKEEISDKNAAKFVEIWNEMGSKKMCVEGKPRCLRRCNSSDRALAREQNGTGCELGFRESDSSTSSCCSQFPGCCKLSNCCAMIDSELNSFDRVISSETIATLQSAAIRARNMYRAIYMYQQHMESKMKEEEEEEKKFEKTEICEQSKDLSAVDSIDVIVKDSYHSCKYDIEILSRAEIASLSDESEYETSELVSMPVTIVSHNERDVSDEADLQVCRKSSSGAVLKVVESLMELLIQKMGDVKMTDIDCVRTVSGRTCSKVHIAFSKKKNGKNECSISPFSRQNLLMLVYGVVCSTVFWCLQFTITCDVVL
ncbi:uncharacterized protein LOC143207244 [Lasioglossum baleicum]|uniref:uncharacterized protein LOC143207244 n=1 Tax=Lasioglossum baleicum TaxID=434251 RepID=UPI003FCD0D24